MDLTEHRISGETIFAGRIIKLELDQAQLPNGKIASREIIHHPGGVTVLALDADQTVTLVRQFRYPFGRAIWELPAGKLDPGEDTLLAAKRELSEETGLEAREWTYLGYVMASPGYCDEVVHMYLARDLHRKESHPDEDEFLELTVMPFGELVSQVMDGSIPDAKTAALTLKTKVFLGL